MSDMNARNEHENEDQARNLALVEGIRNGDKRAYRTLFELYIDSVINLAYGYTRSYEEAEDISHDVFMSLWENRKNVNIDNSVTGYIFRATRNKALNHLRQRRMADKYRTVEELSVGEDIGYNASYNLGPATLENEELQRVVRAAIAQLPPRLREILLLNKEQGMSYQDIATTLEISVSSVPVQMSRALKRLNELLKDRI